MINVVLPCRNEEKGIGVCIQKIKDVFKHNGMEFEIIVSDSSTDRSPEIAQEMGATVIRHNKVGYGNALLEGFRHAKGDIIIMGDADDSYDFSEIPKLIDGLQNSDMVIGKRVCIEKGAMPKLHKLIGNPLLSFVLRLFFKGKVTDAHSGFRAIRKNKLDMLNLHTTGMEFASEMIIKAIKNRLRISEVPIRYCRRKGQSKLRSFSDGWKHLRFMLVYSPLFLFFIPGISLLIIGMATMITINFNLFPILGRRLDYHPMFIASLFMIVGYQLILFLFFSKIYAATHLDEPSSLVRFVDKYLTIEKAGSAGLILSLIGFIIYLVIFLEWAKAGFGQLQEIKNAIIALTITVIGIQTIFSAFMLSILGIKDR